MTPDGHPILLILAAEDIDMVRNLKLVRGNLARFLEAISPLIENTERLTEVLEFYISCYEDSINKTWAAKLGLDEFHESDSETNNRTE